MILQGLASTITKKLLILKGLGVFWGSQWGAERGGREAGKQGGVRRRFRVCESYGGFGAMAGSGMLTREPVGLVAR
jgi:hypothetical protein